jgi:hypothetical protein
MVLSPELYEWTIHRRPGSGSGFVGQIGTEIVETLPRGWAPLGINEGMPWAFLR